MREKLPGFAPKEAEDLLKSNLEAIKKKVAEGKTLSEADRRFVSQNALGEDGIGPGVKSTPADEHGEKWADSQIDLSKILGIERKTIQRHLKERDCPGKVENGKYNIHEWRYWLKMRGRKGGKKEGPDKNALECKKILQDMAIAEFEWSIKKGRFTDNCSIEKWFGNFGFSIKTAMLAWPGEVAPDIAALFELTPEQAEDAKVRIERFLSSKTMELLTTIADGPWEWREQLAREKESAGAESAPEPTG